MNVQLDLIFTSLADATRRNILERLVDKEMSVSEIAQPYNMSLPAVSKHLVILERANLVLRRREGKKFMLKADLEPLKIVDKWIDFYRQHWQEAFDKLDTYLTELQEKKNNEK